MASHAAAARHALLRWRWSGGVSHGWTKTAAAMRRMRCGMGLRLASMQQADDAKRHLAHVAKTRRRQAASAEAARAGMGNDSVVATNVHTLIHQGEGGSGGDGERRAAARSSDCAGHASESKNRKVRIHACVGWTFRAAPCPSMQAPP